MGIGRLLKGAVSVTTELAQDGIDSALDTYDARRTRTKISKLLKTKFSESVSPHSYSLNDFFLEISSIERGGSLKYENKVGTDFHNLGELCLSIDSSRDFALTEHDSGILAFKPQRELHRRILRQLKECTTKDEMRNLLESNLRNAIDSGSAETSLLTRLSLGLKAAKSSLSITKITNSKCNINFRSWLEEAVDPIIETIENETKTMERALAGTLSIDAYITAFKDFLENEAKLDDLLGENQGEMVQLYRAMHDAFDRHGLIAINKLATVPKDVHRINQIETIIDLYNLKISRTEKDKKLDADVKSRKIQALQHLMEKDIEALGGAV